MRVHLHCRVACVRVRVLVWLCLLVRSSRSTARSTAPAASLGMPVAAHHTLCIMLFVVC